MTDASERDAGVLRVGLAPVRLPAIGIEASLTGHFVLSALHANSAPRSILRLLYLGMDPFNLSDAQVGVLGTRLARHLCPDCREIYVAADEELSELAEQFPGEYREGAGAPEGTWRARRCGMLRHRLPRLRGSARTAWGLCRNQALGADAGKRLPT